MSKNPAYRLIYIRPGDYAGFSGFIFGLFYGLSMAYQFPGNLCRYDADGL